MAGNHNSGRKRLSVADHKANGTYQHSRHGDPIEAPQGTLQPGGLLDVTGQKYFKHTVKLLKQIPQLLAAVDVDAIIQYSAAWAAWEEATLHIREHGAQLRHESKWYANPACRRQQAASDQIRRMMIEFGMTPSSRASLRLPETTEADAMETFLATRKAG